MALGPLKLYHKKQLVGLITNVSWSDFPWIAGQFEARRTTKQLRAVLEWFTAQSQADKLEEPPFSAEFIKNWSIVKPDQSTVHLLCPPIIDFAGGTVEWRE